MLQTKYAFLIASLIFLFIWLIIFLVRRDLRREILTLSLFSLPIGFTEPLFTRDYWHPSLIYGDTLGIEVFIFCFAIGGIAASLYEFIFKKKISKKKYKKPKPHIIALFAVILIWSIFGMLVLSLNSIYVSSIGLTLAAFYLIFVRKDLISDAVWSGVMFACLMFMVYQVILLLYPDIITQVWYLENVSSILIVGVPIEELLWGFSWGFFAGPLYEEFKGYDLVKS